MTPRFLEKYKNEVAGNLAKEFGYKNVMEIPRLKKIVVNIGAGEAKVDIKYMDVSMAELTAITGQRPLLKRAKSPWQASRSARECLSPAPSPSGEPACGNSSTGLFPSPFPASRTSRE